ncbi:MAG: hypothetical protein ACI4FX_03200 [Agathobacter sp.]
MPLIRDKEIVRKLKEGESPENLSKEYGLTPKGILHIGYGARVLMAEIQQDTLRGFLWHINPDGHNNLRIYNALKRAGINTPEDVAAIKEKTHIRGINDTVLSSVRMAAMEYLEKDRKDDCQEPSYPRLRSYKNRRPREIGLPTGKIETIA